MLEINDLQVSYNGVIALKGISLSVSRGTVACLIGANGAGKTTTLMAVMGLLKPHRGTITFEGESLVGLSPAQIVARGVAVVPEGRRIFPSLTVEENLKLGAVCRWDRSRLRREIRDMMELFPALGPRLKQDAGTLSGGEQQMLAIARGLMARPKLLLLDEPSMGLAPILMEAVFSLIRELNERGTTVLLVEQNARMALSIAHMGYVLSAGRIVLEGSGQELAASDYVRRAYLGD